MVTDVDVIAFCLRHFKHLDESNAAIHMAPVRYSPITFALAERIRWRAVRSTRFSAEDMQNVREVLAHRGKYALDKGR